MLRHLGRATHHHPWWFIVTWLLLTVFGGGFALGAFGNESLFDRLSSGGFEGASESTTGTQVWERGAPSGPSITMVADGIDLKQPSVMAAVKTNHQNLKSVQYVAAISDPTSPPIQPSPFFAKDGKGLAVNVVLAADLNDSQQNMLRSVVTDKLTQLGKKLTERGGTYHVGGEKELIKAINNQAHDDLKVGEAIALPLSLLVMALVFGGFIAAGMPIIGAIASISGGLLALLGFSHFVDLNSSIPSVVTVLGLGLCIDYGLLLTSRYREEFRASSTKFGAAPETLDAASDSNGSNEKTTKASGNKSADREHHEYALQTTLHTAGRTLMFSGITVALSLCGLLFFRTDILRAIGMAGISVVVVAMLVALTLVPALITVAGDRMVNPGITHRIPGVRRLASALADVAPRNGIFIRLAQRVQRHPWLVMIGALAMLAVMAIPSLHLKLLTTDSTIMPKSSPQRQLFDTLDEKYPGLQQPHIVLVGGGSQAAQMQAWGASVAKKPGVRMVGLPTVFGKSSYITVVKIWLDVDASSSTATALVSDLREQRPDFPSWVTGRTAQFDDYLTDIKHRAPWAITMVVLATFLLLFLMTGSVFIPLKALVMNMLSLAAAAGAVVWIFQDGRLEGLLRYTSNGGINETLPPIVLAFAFGLAVDYELFLLSRIKEAREATARAAERDADSDGEATDFRPDNDAAVRDGLQRSGRIITSAAIIMAIVLLGFAFGDLLIIKQLGVGLAIAVLLDATIVRMLLVPATMTILGEWNWWAPRPLRALHHRFALRD